MKSFKIGIRRVGLGSPVFIIAEAGVNHNGEIRVAERMVDAAAKAGVDAVKFQTFQAGKLVSRKARKAKYQIDNMGSEEPQYEMLKKLELHRSYHERLMRRCREKGVMFISTPFDYESAEMLADLKVPCYKIGSGELNNLPFLKFIAQKKKPVLLSTGMGTLAEIETALEVMGGNRSICLLHCTTDYPADFSEINLRAMVTIGSAFGLPIGYSDHSMGLEVSLAAVALGACIIEKHFTLDRSMSGPDHKASLEPDELVNLVEGIRRVESALGSSRKRPSRSERIIRSIARKSIVAEKMIERGEVIRREMISVKRPGNGLSPSHLNDVIGMRPTRTIPEGTPLRWKDFK